MSKKSTNNYTSEFKESAVKLAIESDQPVTQTAKDLGVNISTLHTWINKYHKDKSDTRPSVNDEHIYDENKRLRKENVRLREEREILKKAAAFFARESR